MISYVIGGFSTDLRRKGTPMEVRTGSKTGPEVAALPFIVETIATQLRAQQPTWLEQLTEHPERFADLEVKVHQTFLG